MGDFRIEIQGTGGHGCSREVKDGEIVSGCGLEYCPDCIARRFVSELKTKGLLSQPQNSATLIHWPGHVTEVRDDLITGIRHGNF
jgi:hypothetical protein